MMKNLLAIGLCAGILVVGLVTSSISAKNRKRESRLDQMQRKCEQTVRQNEHLSMWNSQREWALFSDEGLPEDEREALHERPVPYVDI